MRGARHNAFTRDERVLWRRVFGGVLLCLPESSELVTVTGPGADLWEMLAEPQTIGSVAQRLARHYTATADEVATGIEPVIDDLAARAAIRPLGSMPYGDQPGDASPQLPPEHS